MQFGRGQKSLCYQQKLVLKAVNRCKLSIYSLPDDDVRDWMKCAARWCGDSKGR